MEREAVLELPPLLLPDILIRAHGRTEPRSLRVWKTHPEKQK